MRATRSPRSARSRATPVPFTPPPTTATSKVASGARSSTRMGGISIRSEGGGALPRMWGAPFSPALTGPLVRCEGLLLASALGERAQRSIERAVQRGVPLLLVAGDPGRVLGVLSQKQAPDVGLDRIRPPAVAQLLAA